MAANGAAQESKPYNLDDVMTLVQAGVSSSKILSTVRTACISFKMTQSVSDRLRSEGANDSLVEGLRSACFKSSSDSKENDSRDVRPSKRVIPERIIRKTDTVRVRKVDTVFVPRPAPAPPPAVVPPVVTPYTPPISGTSTLVDWDFRSSQPLTSGRFGKCQYDYGSGGYTVAVAENGGPCYDGSSTELEPNVRISTVALPVGGNGGYTYGVRFGVSDDSTIGYYALEVSALGHFELSRYRMHKWEVLFPWDNGNGINAATTGLANTIVVEIRGSQLTFIINGIQQRTYTAAVPVRGRAGFGIFGYGDDPPWPRVAFSSFREQNLYSPQPATLSSGNAVDWDFRSVQPLTSGRFGKCQYDYSSAGYTISVAENGTTCIDGPLGDQPASVRISTTATPVHGTGGYTYGIRFGYTSDSTVGYYAFEVSIGGSFQLSRYRMNRWEPLIPWQKSSAINAGEGNTNTLAVDVRGTYVTLYVNGTQVGTYQTPLQPVGPAGFGIIGYPEGVPYPMITFSRFSVGPI